MAITHEDDDDDVYYLEPMNIIYTIIINSKQNYTKLKTIV